jgi:transposase-like protein
MPFRFRPSCPHCASRKLTFLEHGAGVSVFRCEDCARTSTERHEPVTHPMKHVNDFVFPDWFTGASR